MLEPISLIKYIDLTSLNDTDTWETVTALYHQASQVKEQTNQNVAALCIWPKFVERLFELRTDKTLKIATVINFPYGRDSVEACLKNTEIAITQGADEIDLVLPYESLINGDKQPSIEIVSAAAAACLNKAQLKVIIESGELKTERLIKTASEISLDNGAHFIKTSTGKSPISATTEAAKWMLETIHISHLEYAGFKASGGIVNYDEALEYINIADAIMGESWLTPERFRFGASRLLKNLVNNSVSISEGEY